MIVGAILALALQAEPDPPCVMSTATLEATLKFADYPARAWSGPVVKPRQDTRFARLFRTVLKLGAATGPNFAGRYTVVTWGCGTDCQSIAIIDAKTGAVRTAPFVTAVGARYRLDSRLFVANPPEAARRAFGGKVPSWARPEYYEWTGAAFVQIDPPARAQER